VMFASNNNSFNLTISTSVKSVNYPLNNLNLEDFLMRLKDLDESWMRNLGRTVGRLQTNSAREMIA
jgi:hypothetical protein